MKDEDNVIRNFVVRSQNEDYSWLRDKIWYDTGNERKAMGYGRSQYLDEKPNEVLMFGNSFVCSLNKRYKNLIEEIKKSFYILELEEDYDEEGGLPYELAEFNQAIKFIVKIYDLSYAESLKIIGTPKIFHGPNNTVDVEWNYVKYKCLLNIDSKANKYSYYGEAFNPEHKIELNDADFSKVENEKSLTSFLSTYG